MFFLLIFLGLDTNDFDFFQAFIVNEILDNGFNAAVQGYLQAQVTFNYNSMAEFETECELFSYHGEEMARIGKNYASKKYDQFSLAGSNNTPFSYFFPNSFWQ